MGDVFVARTLAASIGDGERKTLLTRQMPYEPFLASVFVSPWVLFGSGCHRKGGLRDLAQN